MRMAVFEVGPVPSAAASSCEGGCNVIPAGRFVHHQSTVRPIREHVFSTNRLRLHYGSDPTEIDLFVEPETDTHQGHQTDKTVIYWHKKHFLSTKPQLVIAETVER